MNFVAIFAIWPQRSHFPTYYFIIPLILSMSINDWFEAKVLFFYKDQTYLQLYCNGCKWLHNLPHEVCVCPTIVSFRQKHKAYLFNKASSKLSCCSHGAEPELSLDIDFCTLESAIWWWFIIIKVQLALELEYQYI